MLIHITPDLLAKAAFHQQGINPSWLTGKAQQLSWHAKGKLAYYHCGDFIVLLLQYSYWFWWTQLSFFDLFTRRSSEGLYFVLRAGCKLHHIQYKASLSKTRRDWAHPVSFVDNVSLNKLYWGYKRRRKCYDFANVTQHSLCRILSGCLFSPPGSILSWEWSEKWCNKPAHQKSLKDW